MNKEWNSFPDDYNISGIGGGKLIVFLNMAPLLGTGKPVARQLITANLHFD